MVDSLDLDDLADDVSCLRWNVFQTSNFEHLQVILKSIQIQGCSCSAFFAKTWTWGPAPGSSITTAWRAFGSLALITSDPLGRRKGHTPSERQVRRSAGSLRPNHDIYDVPDIRRTAWVSKGENVDDEARYLQISPEVAGNMWESTGMLTTLESWLSTLESWLSLTV